MSCRLLTDKCHSLSAWAYDLPWDTLPPGARRTLTRRTPLLFRRHIPTTARDFCVPWDSPVGGPKAATCVFLLAVTPHHRIESALVNVLAASSMGGQTVYFLDEGQPTFGAVSPVVLLLVGLAPPCETRARSSSCVQVYEQADINTNVNYVYYQYTASLGGVPPPAVQLTLNAFNGRAEMCVIRCQWEGGRVLC